MPDSNAFKTALSGDLAFIAKKEFEGKVRTDEGTLTAAGDLCTLTANTGKDMYLARAKLSFRTAGGDFTMQADLKLNGVVIESCRGFLTSVGGGTTEYEFKNVGLKVVADDIIKIELISFGGAGTENCEGFIQCWEENTGVDPTL